MLIIITDLARSDKTIIQSAQRKIHCVWTADQTNASLIHHLRDAATPQRGSGKWEEPRMNGYGLPPIGLVIFSSSPRKPHTMNIPLHTQQLHIQRSIYLLKDSERRLFLLTWQRQRVQTQCRHLKNTERMVELEKDSSTRTDKRYNEW